MHEPKEKVRETQARRAGGPEKISERGAKMGRRDWEREKAGRTQQYSGKMK